MHTRRQVKIIATLGPASSPPDVLARMMHAGLDVARINCSHSSSEEIVQLTTLVRKTSRSVGRPVGILLDLGGPKLRTGRLHGGNPVNLTPGAELVLDPDCALGTAERVGVSWAGLSNDVHIGDVILLDDGLLELVVREVQGTAIRTEVVVGGLLAERKGLNLPGTRLGLPALSDKDRADLAVGVRCGVDCVALSFVQTAADVKEVRRLLGTLGSDMPVVAKIARPQAVTSLEEILDACDGVMVARGDLGVEAGSHCVPMIQKRILHEAGRRGMPDITATQMLDSMIRNPRPTRAEASDVANAILDGTDAIMLSGETSVGRWPVESIEMMCRIAQEVEGGVGPRRNEPPDLLSPSPAVDIARAASTIASTGRYRTIIVLTSSGGTARVVSAFCPDANIVALTPSERALGRLTFVKGVLPVFLPFSGGTDRILAAGAAELLRRGLVEPGEEVVLVSGQLDSWGVTHLLKILTIREDQGDGPGEGRVAVTHMMPAPRFDPDA